MKDRLRAHGLLTVASDIAARHGCDAERLTADARAELLGVMRERGWSEKNASLLLGTPPPPESGTRIAVEQFAPHPIVKIGERPPAPEGVSRDAWRSRRVRSVRAVTQSMKRFPLAVLRRDGALYTERPGVDYERPKTRGDCVNGPRPCPFVSCEHHLYLDVNPRRGSIKLNFPDLEVDEIEQTCALDVADAGGLTLERTAVLLNVTRERIRQIEERAKRRLRVLMPDETFSHPNEDKIA